MAVTVIVFNKFLNALGNKQIDFDTDSFKAMMLTSSWTPNIDTQNFRGDINANESSGTNYVAGGVALTTPTWTRDDGNDRSLWDFDDPTFTNVSVSFRYIAIYQVVGSAATDILVCYLDYGGTQTVSGTTVVAPLNASGLLALRQAP